MTYEVKRKKTIMLVKVDGKTYINNITIINNNNKKKLLQQNSCLQKNIR